MSDTPTEPDQQTRSPRPNVAIIGFTQHGYSAPWGDPHWEFWGLNDLHSTFEQYMPGCFQGDAVRWFQLHRRGADGQYPGARDPVHTKWLAEQKIPIYMWAHDPAIPSSVPYPIEDVLMGNHLPTGQPFSPEQYYNNSISWMIALAILMGFKTIGLYGVDMAMDGVHGESEYQHQRPSVEYFVGLARGLGINVVMPQESELCKCAFLYGWDNITHMRKKLLTRYEGLVADEAASVDAYETTKRAIFMVRGALELLVGDSASPDLLKIRAALPADVLKTTVQQLRDDEARAVNENEGAKRSLHEVRGAKNNTAWMLKNYWPGDAPIQDVPRTEASITITPVASAPPPSDGKGAEPVNRIMELVKD